MIQRQMLTGNSSPAKRKVRFNFNDQESAAQLVQEFKLDSRLTARFLQKAALSDNPGETRVVSSRKNAPLLAKSSKKNTSKTRANRIKEKVRSIIGAFSYRPPTQSFFVAKRQKPSDESSTLQKQSVIQNAYPNNVMLLKKDAAKQTLLELLASPIIADQIDPEDGNYYVNAVMNFFAQQLGLTVVDDQDVNHCDKKIVATLCRQFATNFTVEAILNYQMSQLGLTDGLTINDFSILQAKLDSYGIDESFLQRREFILAQEQKEAMPETSSYLWHTLQRRTANYFDFELEPIKIKSSTEILFFPKETSRTSLKFAYVVKEASSEPAEPFIVYCSNLLWGQQYDFFSEHILPLLSDTQKLELIKELFVLFKQEAICYDIAGTGLPTEEEYNWLANLTRLVQYIRPLYNDTDITPILDLAIHLPNQIALLFCHSVGIQAPFSSTEPKFLSRYLFMQLMNNPYVQLSHSSSPLLSAELIKVFSVHYAARKSPQTQLEWIKKFLIIAANPTFQSLFEKTELVSFIEKVRAEPKALLKSLDLKQKFPQNSGNLVAYVLHNHLQQNRLEKLREIASGKAELVNIIGDASQLLAILKELPAQDFSVFFKDIFPCYRGLVDALALHTMLKELDSIKQRALLKALGKKVITEIAGNDSSLLLFFEERTSLEGLHVKPLDLPLQNSNLYKSITCNQKIIFYSVGENKSDELIVVEPQNLSNPKNILIEKNYQVMSLTPSANQNQFFMIMKDAKNKKYLRIYDAITHEMVTDVLRLPGKTAGSTCNPRVMTDSDGRLFVTTENEVFLFNAQNKQWKQIPLNFDYPGVSCSFHLIGDKIAIIRQLADSGNKYLYICDANFTVLSERRIFGEFCHLLPSGDGKSFLIQTESFASFYNLTQDGNTFEKRKLPIFSKEQEHKTITWLKTGAVAYLSNTGIMQIDPSNHNPTHSPTLLFRLSHDLLSRITCLTETGDSLSFCNKMDCVVMPSSTIKPSRKRSLVEMKEEVPGLNHLPAEVQCKARELYSTFSAQKKEYENELNTSSTKHTFVTCPAKIKEKTLANKKIAALRQQCQILEALDKEFERAPYQLPIQCVRNVKRNFPILAQRESFWRKSHTPLQILCREIKMLPARTRNKRGLPNDSVASQFNNRR